ncbi:putative glutaredoxin-like, plant II, Thioredoxin-like superfamily [Helianthus debilis subsp. tardiflorus]
MDRVNDLASKSVAVIFAKSTCFMSHSVKALFYDFGASPAIDDALKRKLIVAKAIWL